MTSDYSIYQTFTAPLNQLFKHISRLDFSNLTLYSKITNNIFESLMIQIERFPMGISTYCLRSSALLEHQKNNLEELKLRYYRLESSNSLKIPLKTIENKYIIPSNELLQFINACNSEFIQQIQGIVVTSNVSYDVYIQSLGAEIVIVENNPRQFDWFTIVDIVVDVSDDGFERLLLIFDDQSSLIVRLELIDFLKVGMKIHLAFSKILCLSNTASNTSYNQNLVNWKISDIEAIDKHVFSVGLFGILQKFERKHSYLALHISSAKNSDICKIVYTSKLFQPIIGPIFLTIVQKTKLGFFVNSKGGIHCLSTLSCLISPSWFYLMDVPTDWSIGQAISTEGKFLSCRRKNSDFCFVHAQCFQIIPANYCFFCQSLVEPNDRIPYLPMLMHFKPLNSENIIEVYATFTCMDLFGAHMGSFNVKSPILPEGDWRVIFTKVSSGDILITGAKKLNKS
eukprot:TRINITY_DN524_c0_g1_i1.p1 TRINITY_DN524_c0_g1~~TRINITY_DN524_c0_g1_i1.p1  ORF type:complete len:454 (+),score=119.68 TRINITY_DN524_c0_g1_i1:68-1429(+)